MLPMTNEQRKKARERMKEWLVLTRGEKPKAERVKKWRELVREIQEDEKLRKEATQRAKATRARRKQLAEKFKAYR